MPSNSSGLPTLAISTGNEDAKVQKTYGCLDAAAKRHQAALTAYGSNYLANATSLLFLYKNLITRLSELKSLIGVYEKLYGGFHLVLICINSCNVGMAITAALTEARIIREMRKDHALSIMGIPDVTTFIDEEEEAQWSELARRNSFLTVF